MIQKTLYKIYQYGDSAPKNILDRRVVHRLKKDGYIETTGSEMFLTYKAHEMLQAAFERPYYNHESERRFRHEVLTGTDTKGRETKIKKAALPKQESYQELYINEPDIDILLHIDRLSKKSGLEPLKIAILISEDLAKICPICEQLQIVSSEDQKICKDCLKKN